jgi:hypothetical protein
MKGARNGESRKEFKNMINFHFSFQGISVTVLSDCPDIVDALRVDFGALDQGDDKKTTKQMELHCFNTECTELLPAVNAVMVQPRYASFDIGDERWVDYYNGEALVQWNFKKNQGSLWSRNKELMHEVAYLIVLARLGDFLDDAGLCRIHALGISVNGSGVMLLLPSGGGKTTLSLRAMELPFVKLLSDDITLAKSDGTLVGFPMRIGVCSKPSYIEDKYLSYFPRSELGPKWLIDLSAFEGKLESRSKAKCTLIGVRNLNCPARIFPAGRLDAFKAFLSGSVIGVGIPQLIELFLSLSLPALFIRTRVTIWRLYVSLKVSFLTKPYFFELSRSSDENFEVFSDFLKELHRKSDPGNAMAGN